MNNLEIALLFAREIIESVPDMKGKELLEKMETLVSKLEKNPASIPMVAPYRFPDYPLRPYWTYPYGIGYTVTTTSDCK